MIAVKDFMNETYIPIILGILAFLILAAGAWRFMWWTDFEGTRSSAEYAKACKTREAMDAQQFYKQFYSQSAIPIDIVVRLHDLQSKHWGVDAKLIRPQDDYIRILGDLDSVEFVLAIESEFEITISDSDCEQLDGSTDTLVKYIAARRQETA